MNLVTHKLERGHDTELMPYLRDREAPPTKHKTRSRAQVGASIKSRSVIEKCWFPVRTAPRTRGEDFKTLNLKKEPNSSEHNACWDYQTYRRNLLDWLEKISRWGERFED
jgi:hypothetical protein